MNHEITLENLEKSRDRVKALYDRYVLIQMYAFT
jgi:hypothetical protein